MKDALDIAEALSAAIMAKDLAAMDAVYAGEVIVWHSYDRTEQDKWTTMEFLRGLFQGVDEIRYSDIRRVRTDEGFVQQHMVHVTLQGGERVEPRPVCFVAKVKSGKIVRLDEYIEGRRAASRPA